MTNYKQQSEDKKAVKPESEKAWNEKSMNKQ